jgi:predicted nucleic acid-binding protein
VSTFFDTNVIVYALDPLAGPRHARADALLAQHLEAGTLVLSTQVLQETYAVLTRKRGTTPARALEVVSLLAQERVLPSSAEFVLDALALAQQHQLSVWDALIVHAAVQARCSVLLSEDLQAGRRFGPVEIVNPFAPGVQAPAAAYRGRRSRTGV